MARYSRTPMTFFLELTLDELYEWIKLISAEIEAENKALEASKGGHP